MGTFFEDAQMAFPLEGEKNIGTQMLPRIHSTSAMRALTILNEEVLHARSDNKIKENEPHLYYFYGRAAYPIAKGELPRGDYSHFTFCFLFECAFEDIQYTFPFDSGAFLHELYKDALSFGKEDLPKFSLPNNGASVNEFIHRVFGNHYNYVIGDVPEKVTNIGVNTSFEVQGYWNLIRNNTKKIADSRCKTIEMVSTSDLQLYGNLLAVIMPEILLDNNIYRAFRKKYSHIDIITYPCFFGDTDDSYYGVVRERAYEYLVSNKMIEKRR